MPSAINPATFAGVREWAFSNIWIGPVQGGPWVLDQLEALRLQTLALFELDSAVAPNLQRLTIERCWYALEWDTSGEPLPKLLQSCTRLVELTLSHITYPWHLENGGASFNRVLFCYKDTLETLTLLGSIEWQMFLKTDWRMFSRLRSITVGGNNDDCEAFQSSDSDSESSETSHSYARPIAKKQIRVEIHMPESFERLTLVSRDKEHIWKTRIFCGTPSSAELLQRPNAQYALQHATVLNIPEALVLDLSQLHQRMDVPLEIMEPGQPVPLAQSCTTHRALTNELLR